MPGGPCDSGGHAETQVPSAGEWPEADRFRLHHKRVGREKENRGPILQGPATFRSHEEDEEAFGSKKTKCPTRPRQRTGGRPFSRYTETLKREAATRVREAGREETREGFLLRRGDCPHMQRCSE